MGMDMQLIRAATADQGAGPSRAFEGPEVLKDAPDRASAAGRRRRSPIIAKFGDRSKPRLDRSRCALRRSARAGKCLDAQVRPKIKAGNPSSVLASGTKKFTAKVPKRDRASSASAASSAAEVADVSAIIRWSLGRRCVGLLRSHAPARNFSPSG